MLYFLVIISRRDDIFCLKYLRIMVGRLSMSGSTSKQLSAINRFIREKDWLHMFGIMFKLSNLVNTKSLSY